jgi:hypothetical protein
MDLHSLSEAIIQAAADTAAGVLKILGPRPTKSSGCSDPNLLRTSYSRELKLDSGPITHAQLSIDFAERQRRRCNDGIMEDS